MAVLAKPDNRLPLIKKEDSSEFIKKFNENKVTEDDKFQESCKKAGELFGKSNS